MSELKVNNSSSRFSMQGTDVFVNFKDERLHDVQGGKVLVPPSNRGFLTFIGFCGDSNETAPEFKELLDQTGTLKIFAANESGHTYTLFEDVVTFDSRETFDFAMDDIVLGIQVGFTWG